MFGLKRVFDLLVATTLLVVFLPIMLALLALVPLTSRGGPIYASERVGLGGKEFVMYKFRSMHLGADSQLEEFRLRFSHHLNGPFFKHADDPRVTRVGRVIRRLSLDELPQLLNVLRGDMSVVGPRPALPIELATMGPHASLRTQVKPGMTGPCQVAGRANLDYLKCYALEAAYIAHPGLKTDIWILLKTIAVVINKAGAH